ncbi:MAG: amino acid ABC transporter permease [Firmicutes bacterium HGW-Firmicutes-16]|nr:MAG: amino acid ABC transporter permease [Firmicutes bacterium HGW-Firmicutes-16]
MKFFDILVQTFPTFTKAMLQTVEVTILSLFFATVLGVVFCMFKMSKLRPLQWIANVYISIIRGTPLMVQMLFIYFGVSMAIRATIVPDFRWNLTVAGIVIMSLNAGAYMTELIRGGIEAVDKGQMEAARSLGLSYGQAMKKIIMPQAFRLMLPSIINQFIITLKDTSLLSVIALRELTQNTRIIVANNMEYFIMYAIVGIYYWVIVSILAALAKMIERRTTYGK